jgi:LuxR family quorum sensing-dependent transcriptional regulator
LIQGLKHLDSIDSVLASMRQATAKHGFETLLFFGLPTRSQGFDDVVLGKHWPDEWTRIYAEGHYMHDDPVIKHLRRATKPFEWREVTFDAERDPRSAELMRLRSEFGFKNAFVVPVPGMTGTLAGVSMSGARPELTAWNKPAINMMALYAFETMAAMRNGGPAPYAGLTECEQEVLTWVAAGRTAWDISEMLSIAQRTTYEHIQNATRKLGALNRTHAVALAMRDGLIAI